MKRKNKLRREALIRDLEVIQIKKAEAREVSDFTKLIKLTIKEINILTKIIRIDSKYL